jgi:SpoVK/Ycf46/Vps4 family AAA+-type ATPase
MIGLKRIKENIVNQIVYFLSGLQSGLDDMMHTIIEGPPGSGKTEVGRILGEVYRKMGLLKSDVFRIVKRSELIGKYLGHTAKNVQDVIDSCAGGVMFIDEAYSLGDNEGRDSFSKECLDTLNQNLSDNKGQFLCIIAGYSDSLDKNFFAFNPGLRRRFTFKYTIEKYSAEELRDIFLQKVTDSDWKISPEVTDIYNAEFFKTNYDLFRCMGGDCETMFLNIRIYHGRRIFCLDKEANRKILNNEDIQEGLKIFAGHRKRTGDKDEIDKMKQYSMYL